MAKGYHKITGNESIGTIAGIYGVDPQTLVKANPGMISPVAGASLRIPSLAPPNLQPSTPGPVGVFRPANYSNTGYNPNRFDNIGQGQQNMNTSYAPNAFNAGLQIAGATFGISPMVNPSITNRSRGVNANYAPPTQAGFQTPFTGTGSGTTDSYSANSFMSATGQVNSQTTNPTVGPDGKPIGFYTGNPNDPNTALFKKYWDDQAKAGVDLHNNGQQSFFAGKQGGFKTLREARIAQRMRRQQNENQDAPLATPYAPPVSSESNIGTQNSIWKI